MTARATVEVCNQRGLHARASARFCEAAGTFESAVTVRKKGCKGDRSADATSLMDLLMLGAARGTEIVIEASGPDEDQALAVLKALAEGGFGEGC